MTMKELAIAWENWLSDHDSIDKENIIDFCSIHATSYEEYMAIYELLVDGLLKEE